MKNIIILFFVIFCSCKTPSNIVKNKEVDLTESINNFNRISEISEWDSIVETVDHDIFYYYDGVLQKVISSEYGEIFKNVTDFYLLNNKISYVVERLYQYNRPCYYNIECMKENGDTESFDLAKSNIMTNKNYFKKGKLIFQYDDTFLKEKSSRKEQKRLKGEFKSIMKMMKN